MAQIPVPRSYNAILGDMIAALLSRFGLKSLKVGSAALSILESAAQSDLRSSQDTFDLLNAQALDRADGAALDRIAASENLQRLTESPASGTVTIGDSSFTKISSKIYQGQPAPIVGSAIVYVTDASAFPASGSVYLGRGTGNYEGPLAYTAKTNAGTYWSLALSDNTRRFHNLGETVVLAQGGNRVISSATLVQTPQANTQDAVKFATLFSATIPDGETQILGVQVLAQKPGVGSNASAQSVSSFVTLPFVGATVSNSLPFTNGQAAEDNKTLKERIKAVRQSKAKGTALAMTTNVQGITATDENKRLSSSSVVTRKGYPATLYIDDGTGYEEKSAGVAVEPLVDLASGGEQYFQVSAPRPVSKAFLVTTGIAPFQIVAASKLAVSVGGIVYEHTFSAESFRAIGNATAYEIATAINGNPLLGFSASTAEAGTKVRIFAKSDQLEDVAVVSPGSGIDANPVLLFARGRVDTMRLYKNDRLLSKDGNLAVVLSKAFALWGQFVSGETLQVGVDSTSVVTYTFVDQDFVDAGTGFTAVGRNSVSAWAKVLNAKIPGITASAANGLLEVISNSGYRARAQLVIGGGSLVTPGQMFAAQTVTGADNDYSLDRNTGQIRLETALAAGDSLSAGTISTRAFLQSAKLTTTAISGGAKLWLCTDGSAQIVNTGLNSSTTLVTTIQASPAWGFRIRITAGASVFTAVKPGDWMISWDTGINAAMRGLFRVVQSAPTYVEIERRTSTGMAQGSFTLSTGGLVFVRANADIQQISIAPGANYTAQNFVDSINTSILGAGATVYQTNSIRVNTKTYELGGDIALVAVDTEGAKLQIPAGNAVKNLSTHLASVASGNSQAGTPEFTLPHVIAGADTTVQELSTTVLDVKVQNFLIGLRTQDELYDSATPLYRHGHNLRRISAIQEIATGGTVVATLRIPTLEQVIGDRVYLAAPFSTGPGDNLVVVADQDTDSKRFNVPLYRKLKPVGGTYAALNTFKDADNSNSSLALAFGLGYDFNDFAVYMASRVKTDSGDSTKTILWRYTRLGPDGDTARLRYSYPDAPAQGLLVSVDAATSKYTNISIVLASGPLKTGYSLRNASKLGTAAATGPGGLTILSYIAGYSVSSATRVTKLNYTGRGVAVFAGTVTGGTSGATATVVSDSLAGGLTGAGTLTLSGVAGTFSAAEVLTGSVTGTGSAAGAQYNVVTLTLTLPTVGGGALADITSHGFAPADSIYLQSSNVNFPSGLKTLTAVTATTASYTDATAFIGTAANIGTVSSDSTGAVAFSGAAPTPVAVGDILRVTTTTTLPAAFQSKTMRIGYYGAQVLQGYVESYSGAIGGVPSWTAVGDSAGFKIYGLDPAATTASSIATAVKALAAAQDSICPVTAVITGNGAGTVSQSSSESALTAGTWLSLVDGVNYVKTTTSPGSLAGDYQLLFKTGINSSLATGSDWANEDVRLVPLTAKNLVNWMNTLTVTGLSSVCAVEASSQAQKLQLSSLTPGSAGSVQVQGGTGNSGAAAVSGSASLITDPDTSTYSAVTVEKADAQGFFAGMWTNISNAGPAPKAIIQAATALTSWGADGVLTFDTAAVTPFWSYSNSGPVLSHTWQVEIQGRYVCFSYDTGYVGPTVPSLVGVKEGDWVRIITAVTPTANAVAVSSVNQGIYRVVRVQDGTNGYAGARAFWIENGNGIAETAEADISFYNFDSLMPGDSLSVSTDLWGSANKGTWTVSTVGQIGGTGPQFVNSSAGKHTFKVVVGTQVPAVVGSVGALGTTQSRLVQIAEALPGKLVKRIRAIAPNQADGKFVDVKFDTSPGYALISSSNGSVVTPADKLNFSTDLAQGTDGYSHTVGLIAEANKVIYGDARDPAAYPGVVAVGANLNISGPLVKRITCAFSLRIKSGISTTDVIDRVRSAIAAVVNKTGIGKAIAISDLINAASRVNGVVAVSVVSPSFSSGSDLIPVQPYEKPLVLSLEQDVLVSFVGD